MQIIWRSRKKNCEWSSDGSVIGVRGRLQQNENGNIYVVAERVTFLTSANKNEGKE